MGCSLKPENALWKSHSLAAFCCTSCQFVGVIWRHVIQTVKSNCSRTPQWGWDEWPLHCRPNTNWLLAWFGAVLWVLALIFVKISSSQTAFSGYGKLHQVLWYVLLYDYCCSVPPQRFYDSNLESIYLYAFFKSSSVHCLHSFAIKQLLPK